MIITRQDCRYEITATIIGSAAAWRNDLQKHLYDCGVDHVCTIADVDSLIETEEQAPQPDLIFFKLLPPANTALVRLQQLRQQLPQVPVLVLLE